MARQGRKIRAAGAALAAGLTVALAACTTGTGPTESGSNVAATSSLTSPTTSDGTPAGTFSSPSPTQSPATTVTLVPSAAKQISPSTPITVSVADGTLTSVELTNDAGKQVKGEQSTDGSSWTSAEPLGYGKVYLLSATAMNSAGQKTVKNAQYTTLTPPNMTMPYFQYTGAYALQNGATYGVGIVPIVHWDEPITDKAAAVATLSITTTPHVAGAWYWSDDQNVAFRPQQYWSAHTKVSITVKDYGKQVSPGLYGQADASISFKIGDKHVTIAKDNAPKVDTVQVYFNDKLVNSFHTSMGKHSGEQIGGKYIDFHTMQGTYTVLAHENPANMCSDSYGLPANAPGGYGCERIYWATKISTDGIYLHELDTTLWAQEHGVDVSHGCLNLNQANATWFFQHAQIGDVVQISGTGGPTIAYWQGGAWSVPWRTWTAGGFTVS